MQIKIILIGILVSCSYLIGEYISKVYLKRHIQINEIIKILSIIRMDLSFGMDTLDEVFRKIGDKKDFTISRFFQLISNELRKNTFKTLDEVINENIEFLTKDNYLTKKDSDELKSVLVTLGKSDIDSQQKIIDLSIENFKGSGLESKEEIIKKGEVYKKLSFLIGIIISILIL
ncbi:MAG: stage III sporulation protein AB [Peptostreptococcaceae bacterium]